MWTFGCARVKTDTYDLYITIYDTVFGIDSLVWHVIELGLRKKISPR